MDYAARIAGSGLSGQLTQLLNPLPAFDRKILMDKPDLSSLRVAIMGIGNELNGDDAAGVMVVRKLRVVLEAEAAESPAGGVYNDRLLIIEAGPSPESFGGPLRRFRPDLVLLVDAAELGELPGAIAWIDWALAQGLSASTHTMPPTLFARYLVEQIGCAVMMVGIQPAHLDFDRPVSSEVREAVEKLVADLAEKLVNGCS